MRRYKRFFVGLASMFVAAANCGHSCGESKTDPGPLHDSCTSAQEGARCSGTMGTICEEKLHANPACNEWLVCDTSTRTWTRRPAEKTDCATQCPATFDEPLAEVGNGALCEYPEGTCGIPNASATPQSAWRCAKTTAQRGTVEQCPKVRPAIGSSGCTDSLVCDYGQCQLKDAVSIQCQENAWTLLGAVFLADGVVDRSRCP